MHTGSEDSAGDAAIAKRGRPRRQYNCRHCSKTFKRSEHCVRHERTHTNEKPFACRYCKKAYSRKDLVTRHERTLHPQPGRDGYVEGQISVAGLEAARALVAGHQTPPSDDGLEDGENASSIGSVDPGLDDDADIMMEISATGGPGLHQQSSADSRHFTSLPGQRDGVASAQMTIDMSLHLQSPLADMGDDTQNRSTQLQQQHTASRATESQAPASSNSVPPASFMDVDLSSFVFSPDPTLLASLDQADTHQSLIHDLPNFNFQGPLSNGYGPLPDLVLPAQQLPPISRWPWDVSQRRSSGSEASPSSHSSAETPVLIRDGRRLFPEFSIHRDTLSSIEVDLARRLGVDQLKTELEMPSPKTCEDFLASYISNFHGHFPVIHLPTFSPEPHSSPLFLIMCSIGALYRLDRRRARRLHDACRKVVERADPPPTEKQPSIVKDYPLWFVQTHVLLSFYAIMSGDMDLVSGVMKENGLYTIVYQRARMSLKEHPSEPSQLTWHSWAHVESWKRLLGAMLIMSTLAMVLYHVNPGMNATMDLEFEALHDEKLWSARSSAEWRELYARANNASSIDKAQRLRSMKDVLTDIMLHPRQNEASDAYPVSAFSAFILMHAIVVHMWQRAQVCQAFANTTLGLVPMQEGLADVLVCSGLQTLSRCQQFLDNARNEALHGGGQGQGQGLSAGSPPAGVDEEKEASLVFNSYAILRLAHTKLITSGSPQTMIDLANLHGPGVNTSIASFVGSKAERSTLMLEAVVKAFEGMREPVEMGHLLVRKTAAFRWSVEQAVAGWDCALLVSKWVHGIEMDLLDGRQPSAEEKEMMDSIREVLQEAECEVEEGASLAAAVARTWSWFLRDVWIWGITPVMGEALDQVAEAYKRTLASRSCLF